MSQVFISYSVIVTFVNQNNQQNKYPRSFVRQLMKNLFQIIIWILLPVSAYNQTEELTPFPGLVRDDAVAFNIGNKGYLVTGNHNGFNESNRLWIYDASSNLWIEGSSFPGIPRQYASAFSIGHQAWLIGGISENGTPLNDVWCYNSYTETWSQSADFPGMARWGASACSDTRYGYLIGGTNSTSTTNQCWRFDPVFQSWTALPNYPGIGTREAVLLQLAGKLVYTGGFSINPLQCHRQTYILDLSSLSWQTGTDFPDTISSYLSGSGRFQKGIVFGGWSCYNSFSNRIWETNGFEWNLLDSLPFPGIRGMSSFTIDGQVYSTSGLISDGSKTNRLFRFGTPVNAENIQIYPNPSRSHFQLYAPIGSTIHCIDFFGKMILEQQLTSELTDLELPPGCYLLQINTNDRIQIRKIVSL